MDDKFWHFFRGSAAASARAARGRADGPPRSTRVRLVAERGPCDVRARARGAHVGTRARPQRGRARWAWRCGGDGSCAGTARVMRAAAHACMRACTGVPTKRSTRRARAHPCVLPGAVGDDAQPRSVLCHKGLRQVPLTATPPRPHPRRRPRPSFTLTPSSASPSPSSSQAHGARGRAAPDLAGCPDPGPRARVAAASRPRAVHTPCAPARRGLSRPHAGSALRACDPCYGKAAWATRWHWVWESVWAPRSDNGVRRSPRRDAARARPRTRPTRTLRCGRCPRCGGAVLCGRRAPPRRRGGRRRAALGRRRAARAACGPRLSCACGGAPPPGELKKLLVLELRSTQIAPTPRAHRRHVFLPALAHTA